MSYSNHGHSAHTLQISPLAGVVYRLREGILGFFSPSLGVFSVWRGESLAFGGFSAPPSSIRMIVGVGGTPGSGKSYFVLTKIVDFLRKKRKVFTNIPSLDVCSVAKDLVKERHGRKIFQRNPDLAVSASREILSRYMLIRTQELTDMVLFRGRFSGACPAHFRGSSVVLDEVMISFFSRDYRNFSKELIFFFSQHRKFGMDVWYISQDLEKVDSVIRSMTEKTFVCSNVKNFRWHGLHLPLDVFMVSENNSNGSAASTSFVFPQRRLYGYYDTLALFHNALVDIADPFDEFRGDPSWGVRDPFSYVFSRGKVVSSC